MSGFAYMLLCSCQAQGVNGSKCATPLHLLGHDKEEYVTLPD
jgi:hypothetical protein